MFPACFLLVLFLLAGSANAGQALTPPTDAAARLFAARFVDLDGKSASLADYRGRPLLVNFWARWCQPCRAEIPELARLRRRGLVVVGVALESDAGAVRAFAQTLGMHYPCWLASGGGSLLVALGDRAQGLPLTLAIARSGKIVAAHLGAATAAELEKLAEQAEQR